MQTISQILRNDSVMGGIYISIVVNIIVKRLSSDEARMGIRLSSDVNRLTNVSTDNRHTCLSGTKNRTSSTILAS